MNVSPYHKSNRAADDLCSSSIDDKLMNIHREMASLRVECDRLINKHLLVEKSYPSSSKSVNPDTSSAYNTGESCRSNSISPDATNTQKNQSIPQEPIPPSPTLSPRLFHRASNTIRPSETATNPVAVLLKSTSSNTHFLSPKSPSFSPKSSIQSVSPTRRLTPLKLMPNKDEFANRFRTPSYSIVLKDESKSKNKLEQPRSALENFALPKFFRNTRETIYTFDRPVDQIQEFSEEGEIAGPSRNSQTTSMQKEPEAQHYKWKVKRRCDGSRYVVKRPIRSQVLKKREAQLIKERTGASTDDDAHSELKLGHFHTREERKKHVEKEKERKYRQQQKLLESMNTPVDQTIVELSQRKMQKKKEKMFLDEFVTTQEVLSQRNNSSTLTKKGLLSVTTV